MLPRNKKCTNSSSPLYCFRERFAPSTTQLKLKRLSALLGFEAHFPRLNLKRVFTLPAGILSTFFHKTKIEIVEAWSCCIYLCTHVFVSPSYVLVGILGKSLTCPKVCVLLPFLVLQATATATSKKDNGRKLMVNHE